VFENRASEGGSNKKLENKRTRRNSSPSISTMTLRMARWGGHVTRTEDGGHAHTVLLYKTKGRFHLADLDVAANTILKWIFKIRGGMTWSGFIWLRIMTTRRLL
jgi:hypothetical protein